MSNLSRTLIDSHVIAKRNIIKIKRVPDILVFILISPIMFVLMFSYVFGGAIARDNPEMYREFLIGGIFAQTVVFGSTFTGVGLAEDMKKGIIDRFRSLPMSRAAVLIGRTFSDIIYNILTLVIMGLTGLLVGWRIRGSLLSALGAFVLLLAFAYAFSWVMAYVGLIVPSVEVINNASFIVIMPLTFISNAFVPLESFTGGLKHFVEWNPVSTLTQSTRELFNNVNPFTGMATVPEEASTAWSMQNPLAYTLIWLGIILVIFVPLSVRKYATSNTK